MVEQVLNFGFEFGLGVAVVLENQVALFVASAFHFVKQLGENEFEEFLKHVDACIGKNLVFHFQNQVFEGFFLVDQFVEPHEVVNRPALGQDV